ncbi:MAG: UDP-glucuronosyltransferase [Nitritalea sp.]
MNYNFAPTQYTDLSRNNNVFIKLHYPESAWGEEITVYIHERAAGYTFDAVDFYGNEITLNPESCTQPLSLADVIRMVETLEAVEGLDATGNLALTLSGIPEAESPYYPELKNFFAEKRKQFGLP